MQNTEYFSWKDYGNDIFIGHEAAPISTLKIKVYDKKARAEKHRLRMQKLGIPPRSKGTIPTTKKNNAVIADNGL